MAGWILELDRGHAYPHEGNYSVYLQTKAARMKVEGQRNAKLRRRLEEDLAWVRSSPHARQAKSRTRLGRYEQMAAEAAARTKLDFEQVQIPPGPRLGSLVVQADHLVKGFGDRMLIDGLSFSLPPNGIVGIIGPNGVGKTTLLKMILREEQPDAGTIKVGETVRISYGLARARLEPQSDVIQLVTYDGEHLGHVRREGPPGPGERWVAVQKRQARQVGTYGSAGAAATALSPGTRGHRS